MIIRALDNRVIAVGKNSEFRLLSESTALAAKLNSMKAIGKVAVKP